MSISIESVANLGEVIEGDDLVEMIATHAQIRSGDIVVVSSKIVSKAEGRLIDGDDRSSAVESETARVVARRGQTTIAQTHHGWVMAAAGVDLSDVPQGKVALLPVDADASAERLRSGFLARYGLRIGVIITDTFGRPWREGLIDQAIGVAGVLPLVDHRGRRDRHGRELSATVTAVADEIASATELVRSKSAHLPVAIVRGLEHLLGDGKATDLQRDPAHDWFRLGHREVVTSRRTVRHFSERQVATDLLQFALESGLTAPAPHGSAPFRFIVLDRERDRVLKSMEEAWRSDLDRDGLTIDQIDQRIARGQILHRAPVVIAAFVSLDKAHPYPDQRSQSEREMFIAAGGAAVENVLIALASEGVGSAWISSSFFCPNQIQESLDLPSNWLPLGMIAAGYPANEAKPRSAADSAFIEFR